MYSVVLMVALTASGDSADFGRRGCHGCRGSRGCHSRCGGGYGGYGCSGGYGCCGGGSYGCCGGGSYGCCGGVYGGQQMQPMPQREGLPSPKKTKSGKQQEQQDDQVRTGPAPAYMVVQVPADARVTIDGAATRSTSSLRTFRTPELARDKVFAYDLTAEFQRNGQPVKITKHVVVQGGQTTNIDLRSPSSSVASR
jgi:uncharacterized protein (TIGR03000 family)